MKSFILSLLLAVLCVVGTTAQTVFAPHGAEWYQNTPGGVYRCYTDGDSTILGRTVSVIRQRVIPFSSTSFLTDLPTIYTYTVPDTVYVYNTIHNRFTPLYIFAVADGDTMTIPCFYEPGVGSADSSFTFRVDSVRTVLYDLVPLLTVYTTALDSPAGGVRSTYGPIYTQRGAYAQRLGCVNGGLYPSCIGCGIIPGACNCPTEVTCYKDTAMDIILPLSGHCVPMVSVPETVSVPIVASSPNPVITDLTVTAPVGSTLRLLCVTGGVLTKICMQGTSTTVPMTHLPAGMYMLQVQVPGGSITYSKILK